MIDEQHAVSASFEPLAGGFGARASHDVTRPLSAADVSEIADAFHAYQLLIFSGADLSLAQLSAFIDSFGLPDTGVGRLASDVQGYSGIRVVENVERGKFGPRSNSELHWHSDRFFDPVVAGVLNSIVVPETGGDTSFANMYRAWDELPEDLRAAVEGRSIKQDCLFGPDGEPMIRPGGQPIDDLANSPGIETPIVRAHRFTGRKFLYLGNRLNAYAAGLPIEESEALLDRLFAHIDQPHLHYRHRWVPHELVIYDNVACMHKREAFDENADRKLLASVVSRSDIL